MVNKPHRHSQLERVMSLLMSAPVQLHTLGVLILDPVKCSVD